MKNKADDDRESNQIDKSAGQTGVKSPRKAWISPELKYIKSVQDAANGSSPANDGSGGGGRRQDS